MDGSDDDDALFELAVVGRLFCVIFTGGGLGVAKTPFGDGFGFFSTTV